MDASDTRNIKRTMTTVLAEIARATYHDEIPGDVQDHILRLVREAVALTDSHRRAV
jgi:hypothetical protein